MFIFIQPATSRAEQSRASTGTAAYCSSHGGEDEILSSRQKRRGRAARTKRKRSKNDQIICDKTVNALTHRLSTLMKQIYRCGKLYFFKKAQERRTGNIWMFHLLNPNIGSSWNLWLNSVEDISHTKSELQLGMTSGSPTCDSIWKRGRKRRRNIYTKCPLRAGTFFKSSQSANGCRTSNHTTTRP